MEEGINKAKSMLEALWLYQRPTLLFYGLLLILFTSFVILPILQRLKHRLRDRKVWTSAKLEALQLQLKEVSSNLFP